MPRPIIAVLIPTRGRPQQLRRLLDSLKATSRKNVIAAFYADSDDEYLPEYKAINQEYAVPILTGPPVDFGLKLQLLVRGVVHGPLYKGKVGALMMCGDDAVFATPDWDEHTREAMGKFPDGIYAISHNGGLMKIEPKPKICHPHPLVGIEWYNALGYISPPWLRHFCVDRYVQDIARTLNRFVFMPKTIVEHRRAGHWPGCEKDATYERIRRNDVLNVSDRLSYKHMQRAIAADVALLRSKMT